MTRTLYWLGRYLGFLLEMTKSHSCMNCGGSEDGSCRAACALGAFGPWQRWGWEATWATRMIRRSKILEILSRQNWQDVELKSMLRQEAWGHAGLWNSRMWTPWNCGSVFGLAHPQPVPKSQNWASSLLSFSSSLRSSNKHWQGRIFLNTHPTPKTEATSLWQVSKLRKVRLRDRDLLKVPGFILSESRTPASSAALKSRVVTTWNSYKPNSLSQQAYLKEKRKVLRDGRWLADMCYPIQMELALL